jgi:hypothetical protein
MFDTPMNVTYVPELDVAEELDEKGVAIFQELIGILRWAIEKKSQHPAVQSINIEISGQSKARSLRTVVPYLHIPAKASKAIAVFISRIATMDFEEFRTNKQNYFTEIYRNADEQLSRRMSMPREGSLTMTVFVDASHAANKIT